MLISRFAIEVLSFFLINRTIWNEYIVCTEFEHVKIGAFKVLKSYVPLYIFNVANSVEINMLNKYC